MKYNTEELERKFNNNNPLYIIYIKPIAEKMLYMPSMT